MEESSAEILIYLAVGFMIGGMLCYSTIRQRYLLKYKKSIGELKIRYASDVSQALLVSKKLLEVEEEREELASEIGRHNSTIETLKNQARESAARLAELETELNASQGLFKEKEEEIIHYQERLRLSRTNLEYTATLEERLMATATDYQLKLSDKENEITNLQHRLAEIERTKPGLSQATASQHQSTTQESEGRVEQQATPIQELRNMVYELIQEHPEIIEELNAQASNRDSALMEKDREIDSLRGQIRLLEQSLQLDEASRKTFVEAALSELQAGHQRVLEEKDAEIGRLLDYISGVENLSAVIAKGDEKLREMETLLDQLQTNYQMLESEKAARQSELAEWIKRADELEQLNGQASRDFASKLQEIEASYRAALGDKDAQISEFRERVGFIGTLRKQYAEKEMELQALEEKYQTAVNNKNLEIHFLQERVEQLEKLQVMAVEELKAAQQLKLAEKDFQIERLQTPAMGFHPSQALADSDSRLLADRAAQYQAALGAKDETIADLHERIQALETLLAAHAEETDLKLKEREAELLKAREDAAALEVFVAAHSQEIDTRLKEKEAEIQELQACIAELESANLRGQQMKKMEAQYQAALQTKNSEIVRLQMRINQLEPFSALVAQRDARIRELDSRYQIAIGAKDEEIARLQSRLTELNGKVKMAC